MYFIINQLANLLSNNKIKYNLLKIFNTNTINYLNPNMTTIPKGINYLINLNKVIICNTKITDMTPMMNIKNLRVIILNYNNIKNIPSDINTLVNLRYLSLDGNLISILPEELSQLENLDTLNMYGNKIEYIPRKLFQMKRLENLDFRCNPLKCKEDYKYIINYLKNFLL